MGGLWGGSAGNIRWEHSRQSWRETRAVKCPCAWAGVGRRGGRSLSLPPWAVGGFARHLPARSGLERVVATSSC